EDGIRDLIVTGVQTCDLPISAWKKIRHDYLSADGLTNARRHAANETKLSSGTFGFRRCKGLRLIVRLRGNGFYKCGARGQNKFRSEEHTSELQSRSDLVCRLL